MRSTRRRQLRHLDRKPHRLQHSLNRVRILDRGQWPPGSSESVTLVPGCTGDDPCLLALRAVAELGVLMRSAVTL